MNYLQQQNEIHSKADKFLQKHNLLNILSKFGDIKFFGSYSLNLMNRNDIDIALVVDKISIDIVTHIMTELNKLGFNRHWVFDNTDGGCKDDPKHIAYETIYGFYNSNIPIAKRWEVGIVITTKEILPNVTLLTDKVQKLSDADKKLILTLKFELAEKYGVHKYTGTQVYKAVMENNVKSVKEFMKLQR